MRCKSSIPLHSEGALQRRCTELSSHSRQQLGLHDVANRFWLSEKERVTRQRLFSTLRSFDAYVKSSLGLPRNLRVDDTIGNGMPTDAPYIASPEMLTASNANVELLEIMSSSRESVFFANTTTPGQSSKSITTSRLDEVSTTLSRWALKYKVFRHNTNSDSAISIK
jgi:hypothetical protein